MGEHQYAYPIILNKVASPRFVTPTLRRGRLVDWLHANAGCRAVVLAAAAGYGKTTLLWQWEREVTFPCYWYKLDRTDRDWSLQITYLVEAIARRHPGFGRRATSMLRQLGGPGSSRPGVAAYLLSEMHERLTEPCTFIIDDWQFVSSVTEVRGLWNQILRDAPATCRFVFASRAKPQLQFARFKTHAGYAELRTDAFRFTDEEIGTLFRDIYRNPLETEEIKELEHHTEGWAASLQLIDVSLREKQSPEERRSFLKSIAASSDSDLFAFLAEEVLDQQTDETRNLLLTTSILHQITPDLAERLAGVNDGEQRLTDLEQRGLFTYRQDEARYRYHALFRDFLERRLSIERGDAEIIGLHIHAASYFETSAEWPQAIHHYLKAGLQRQAARLIARYGEEVVSEGRLGMVDEWLEQLPERTIRENARLSLLHGEALGIRGEFPRALAALQRAREFFARKGDPRMEALACVKLSSIHSIRGEAQQSVQTAAEGLAMVPPDAPVIRLRLQGNLTIASAWWNDSLETSAATVGRLATEASALGLDHFAAIAHHNAGVILRDIGRLDDSLRNLEMAARYWSELPSNPFADNFELVVTLLALGQVARAERLADAGVASTSNWRRSNSEALLGRSMVLLYQERFDEAKSIAIELLQEEGPLGALADVCRIIAAEAQCLIDANESELAAWQVRLQESSGDLRHAIYVETTLGLLSHQISGCRGQCLRRTKAIAKWRNRGAEFSAAVAEAKLGGAAFEHGDHAWMVRTVQALRFLAARGSLGFVRAWTRRLIPHARALHEAADSLDVVLALHAADPTWWEKGLIRLLSECDAPQRAVVLQRVTQHASRTTLDALRTLSGADVAATRQELTRRQSTRLFIQTFGPLVIRRGSWSGPVTFVSKRRLRSLLALLASQFGTPMARDAVLDLLWPDADPAAAVNSLNQTVFQLRRLMDPGYRDGESPTYLVATNESVALSTDLVRTDLDEFRRLKARLNVSLGHPPGSPQIAEQMLVLASAPYLPELAYEEWAAQLQLAVEMEVRESLLPIAVGTVLQENSELGLRAASALAAMDEFDEMAHAALARQLATLGKRGRAAEVMRALSDRLRTELKVEVSAEAKRLVNSVGVTVQ